MKDIESLNETMRVLLEVEKTCARVCRSYRFDCAHCPLQSYMCFKMDVSLVKARLAEVIADENK